MKLKLFDYISFLLAIVLIVISIVLVAYNNSGNAFVKIQSGNDVYYYPLNKNIHLEIKGLVGLTTIEIVDNTAHIVDSACENKICVHSGSIQNAGEWLACLPNAVFVTITGNSSDDTIDAQTY